MAQLSFAAFLLEVELELKSAQSSVDDEKACGGAVVVVALVDGVEKKSQLMFDVGCAVAGAALTGAAGMDESQSGWAAGVAEGPEGGGAKKPPPIPGAGAKLNARPPAVLGSFLVALEVSLLMET